MYRGYVRYKVNFSLVLNTMAARRTEAWK